jgi:hypothetical protein
MESSRSRRRELGHSTVVPSNDRFFGTSYRRWSPARICLGRPNVAPLVSEKESCESAWVTPLWCTKPQVTIAAGVVGVMAQHTPRAL